MDIKLSIILTLKSIIILHPAMPGFPQKSLLNAIWACVTTLKSIIAKISLIDVL